ncbi:hypothetical protein AQUCO_04700073v1 [Aquilegia coerulea]|uniref:Uncharacterized protein n=1 Tax=Aquilegia coerulea TaxID=218851 RepID=A0A2G5CL89_AQUCA|nr:hypothetical protein AQUCO_04700073v1 [Aquilegia coerulea]
MSLGHFSSLNLYFIAFIIRCQWPTDKAFGDWDQFTPFFRFFDDDNHFQRYNLFLRIQCLPLQQSREQETYLSLAFFLRQKNSDIIV